MVTPFEGESPAGRLPRLPLYEGLWTVWPVPVSEVGLIAKLRMQTSSPAYEVLRGAVGQVHHRQPARRERPQPARG